MGDNYGKLKGLSDDEVELGGDSRDLARNEQAGTRSKGQDRHGAVLHLRSKSSAWAGDEILWRRGLPRKPSGVRIPFPAPSPNPILRCEGSNGVFYALELVQVHVQDGFLVG